MCGVYQMAVPALPTTALSVFKTAAAAARCKKFLYSHLLHCWQSTVTTTQLDAERCRAGRIRDRYGVGASEDKVRESSSGVPMIGTRAFVFSSFAEQPNLSPTTKASFLLG